MGLACTCSLMSVIRLHGKLWKPYAVRFVCHIRNYKCDGMQMDETGWDLGGELQLTYKESNLSGQSKFNIVIQTLCCNLMGHASASSHTTSHDTDISRAFAVALDNPYMLEKRAFLIHSPWAVIYPCPNFGAKPKNIDHVHS